jgi:hypothetical protein
MWTQQIGIYKMNYDFSGFRKVFCDSKQALKWAIENNLPVTAKIYTSSPALLCNRENNIEHIERRWSVKEMRSFQSSILGLSEHIFNALMKAGVSRGEALVVSTAAVAFQQVVFKAACLTDDDVSQPRLFLKVEEYDGRGPNLMNSPWDKLLKDSPLFETAIFIEPKVQWEKLNTEGVSLYERMRLGGFEVLFYRILCKVTKKLPDWLFRKHVLVARENDLIIETAAWLGIKGARLEKLQTGEVDSVEHPDPLKIYSIVKQIINEHLNRWLSTSIVSPCETMFFDKLKEELNAYTLWYERWESVIKNAQKKSILLINSPVNPSGLALTSICRKYGIPVISAEHGITKEICKTHSELSSWFEINTSDKFLTFNEKSAEVAENTSFVMGRSYVVGLSSRYLRMKRRLVQSKGEHPPIIYISTNLYKGNFGVFRTWCTDYHMACNEQRIVNNVLGKLPHKVLYKTYPEETRRYVDRDPVIKTVLEKQNILLFDKKIDLRYLLKRHRILITSKATSTIGWSAMTHKPLVFINREADSPLKPDAYECFSKGLFLFDADEERFYENLTEFLSKPIEEIEALWAEKKVERKEMINAFFTPYSFGAGKRAADMISMEYFNEM